MITGKQSALQLLWEEMVDTTAAMAGAVSGAYNGLEVIPSHLSGRLTDRGTWGFSELVELADKCYDFKMSQEKD